MGGPPRKQQKRDNTTSATITATTHNHNSSLNWSTPPPPPQPQLPLTSIGSSVIPTINKLQDILSCLGAHQLSQIRLPHVAVVGSQSSGKSSVLEALVGRDFLPRACDICTRRPLILQLHHRLPSPTVDDHIEWGEFLHLPNTKFYDFSAIRREIQVETEREAGRNKGVSDKPIRLKISSPNVLDLTLIDLPGVTKVPVGDQPTDIEDRIRRMIMDHIKEENCIILAVSPANSDLATSDALQMSKEADPKGTRTIGVITKLDIMDRGTDACKFLLGKVIPLHLGYIGVINRSQEDINKNKSVAEALSFEEQFFRDHHEYKGVLDRCGIPQLAKKLNQILEQHIRANLPALKSQIKLHFQAVEEELRTYGDGVESKEREAVVLNILRSYSEAFSSVIDGKNPHISTQELAGGARIRYIFHSIFGKALKEVDPCEDLSDDEIRIAIQNSMGPRNKLFVPEVPFELLIRRQVERLLDPSMQCLQLACDELIKMSRSCESRELQRFPTFRKRVKGVMANFMHYAIKPVEKRIAETIDMEADDINTSHPSFVGGQRAIEIARRLIRTSKGTIMDADQFPSPKRDQKSANQEGQKLEKHDKSVSADAITKLFGMPIKLWGRSSSKKAPVGVFSDDTPNHTLKAPSLVQLKAPSSFLKPSEEPTEDEETEILVIRILLQSYFDIVRNKIEDDVPKAIMHFVVNHLKRDLHNSLIQTFYREDLFEELLQENFDVKKKRKRAQEMFNVLQKAVQALDEIETNIPPVISDNYKSQTEESTTNKSTSMSSSKISRARKL
ncbi:dynamin-related protein 3A-like isoform X2 [Silene latifolia]|uniref:dynamin-related protein 3A-like isoform X2 n=1 Tax=Silene latifolia TaxID=37657 RepID=UPI003D76B630